MEEVIKKDEHKNEHIEKLDKMTVLELREIAKEIPGVEGVTGMKKEQLLAIIKKDRGIEEDKPSKKKAIAKIALTVQELKHKINTFKVDKRVVIEEHNRKKATILRRRINRLKKRIRKAEDTGRS
jgi:hypothetical protein